MSRDNEARSTLSEVPAAALVSSQVAEQVEAEVISREKTAIHAQTRAEHGSYLKGETQLSR